MRKKYIEERPSGLHWNAWPTLDELREATAMMTADTVLQIIRGQGYYYGYEIDREVDNDIPVLYDPDRHDRIVENNRKHARGRYTRLTKEQKILNRLVGRTAKMLGVSKEEAYVLLKKNGL